MVNNIVEPILTPKILKDRYLFGISLTDDNGKTISNSVIADKIKQATSWLEKQLDICIEEKVYSEANGNQEIRDYRVPDFFSWNYFKLHNYPVISVESVKMKFPSNEELINYPTSWFKIQKEVGILQLVPDLSTIPSFYIANGLYLPHIILSQSMVPQIMEFEYTAGFAANQIPYDINDIIGLKAAIDLIEIASDLIIGAGIASQSMSIDGLSQSTSVANQGYDKRIQRYTDRMNAAVETARHYYKGITFTSI